MPQANENFMNMMRKSNEAKNFLAYNPQTTGVTQSLIHTWRACQVKARMTCKGYYRPVSSTTVIFGSVFHEVIAIIENYIKNGDIQSIESYVDHKHMIFKDAKLFFEDDYNEQSTKGKEEYDLTFGILPGLIEQYLRFWPVDFLREWEEIEKAFSSKGPLGVVVRGKRDAIIRMGDKSLWLMEHKTKSMISEDNLGMTIARDLQVLLYISVYNWSHKEKLSGVIYNIIRKPLLRKRSSETTDAFIHRCIDDIKLRPEHYFMRFEVPITESVLNDFAIRFTAEMARFLTWWETSDTFDCENTSNCYMYNSPCQFIDYCDSGRKNYGGLEVREKHFPEL